MEWLSYSSFTILASLVVVSGMYFSAKKQFSSTYSLIILLIVSLTSAFLGARILFLLTSTSGISLANLFDTDFQHFSLFGGLLLGGMVGGFTANQLKYSLNYLANLSVIWIGIGIAIIRIGCFVQGCCFGTETNLPWGITPKLLSPAHLQLIKVGNATLFEVNTIHPTQIYELIAALSGSWIAWTLTKKHQNSLPTFIWIIWFTSWRFIIHFLRAPSQFFSGPIWLYPSVYLTIIAISCGITAFLVWNWYPNIQKKFFAL